MSYETILSSDRTLWLPQHGLRLRFWSSKGKHYCDRYEPRSVIGGRPVINYVRIENAVAKLRKRKHKYAPRVCKNREDGAICVAECVNLEQLAAGR